MLDKSPKFIYYVKSKLLTLCMNKVVSQNRQKNSRFESRKYLHRTKWQVIRVGVSFLSNLTLDVILERLAISVRPQ